MTRQDRTGQDRTGPIERREEDKGRARIGSICDVYVSFVDSNGAVVNTGNFCTWPSSWHLCASALNKPCRMAIPHQIHLATLCLTIVSMFLCLSAFNTLGPLFLYSYVPLNAHFLYSISARVYTFFRKKNVLCV
jgi:hypothetical protein